MMGMTSDECYASNTPWLQTMAYCIQQNCNADGYPAEKQAECFSKQAVAGASTPTFEQSLPATPPTIELAEDAMWLNETSLVNSNVYYSTHGTYGEFARQEYLHTRYSVILYLLVIGTCIIAGAFAHIRGAFPGFQKKLQTSNLWAKLQGLVFLPAFVGTRRLEPLPGKIGYVPSRALGIFITVFVILNVVFSAVNFQSFQPNIWFFSSGFELCEYVGNRTGTLSLVNLTIAILFAGRNNLLLAITGWNQTAFLTLHRWIARVATLQAVVHSIAYTVAYFEPGYEGASAYAAKAADPFFYWGIIGTIALCLALGFAALPFRTKFYEFFLFTHVAFITVALAACWYHLVPHFGFDYGYQVWLYIAFAFWAADRTARVARVLYYNRFGDTAGVVEAVPGCDVLQITVFPRADWKFGPGQHSFLYFPSLGKPWESHPFSIAGWKRKGQELPMLATTGLAAGEREKASQPKDFGIVSVTADSDSSPSSSPRRLQAATAHKTQIVGHTYIQFLVRVHAGMTSSLQKRLLASPSGSKMEVSVYTEGGYAGHRATLQPLSVADTVLCLIGGIGITNALSYIQEYASSNIHRGESSRTGRGVMKKAKRFVLAWSAKEMGLIEHVRRNFLADAEGVEFSFWYTGDVDAASQKSNSLDDETQKEATSTSRTTAGATNGRMEIGTVIRSHLEPGLQTTVLVCGPGTFTDEATRQVVKCVKEGFRVDLVEEAYAW
ncbi:hypothetical protein JX265_005640 [Neoarthrinium moseri]|uniref:FAD-binding FR-type domain-containing protein n=1 Tax=Neoarthrinium moseri TaxID=1658444 RepID=A0A9P9WN30_9PEZI|nr:hypothetical protein JX266_005593 [Neoarthrinium moseri]KAI1871654.1 hypothetical protein JX265_005640 [Neoarthrinium moseri]